MNSNDSDGLSLDWLHSFIAIITVSRLRSYALRSRNAIIHTNNVYNCIRVLAFSANAFLFLSKEASIMFFPICDWC